MFYIIYHPQIVLYIFAQYFETFYNILLHFANFWWHGSLELFSALSNLAWKKIPGCPMEILHNCICNTFYFPFFISWKKRRLSLTAIPNGSDYPCSIFIPNRFQNKTKPIFSCLDHHGRYDCFCFDFLLQRLVT